MGGEKPSLSELSTESPSLPTQCIAEPVKRDGLGKKRISGGKLEPLDRWLELFCCYGAFSAFGGEIDGFYVQGRNCLTGVCRLYDRF